MAGMNIRHHGTKSVRRQRTRNEKVVLLVTVCASSSILTVLLAVLQQQHSLSILPLHRLLMTSSSLVYQEKQQQEEEEEQYVYTASHAEQFLLDHPSVYGFNTTGNQTSSACRLWRSSGGPNTNNPSNPQLFQLLQQYRGYLKPINDLRLQLLNDVTSPKRHDVCQRVNLHANGVQGFFTNSSSSSSRSSSSTSATSSTRTMLSHSTAAGFMEPLLPPMRHPNFCRQDDNIGFNFGYLLDLSYLVHDFYTLCRNHIKLQGRHSPPRIVLFDLGASLNFHHLSSSDSSVQQEPMMQIIALFAKFGFPFDHIYAYEKKATDPQVVFGERLPVALMPAYHWINVGVVAEPGHRLNPFTTLLEKYTKDDIVIVKLDIDTPSIEGPLAHQLLADHGRLAKIIDHFYFEHHVYMEELSYNWGGSMQGSIQDSLQLFHSLRQAGVAAHFWV
jgi:hypothetical protein